MEALVDGLRAAPSTTRARLVLLHEGIPSAGATWAIAAEKKRLLDYLWPIDAARHVGLDGRDVIVVQTKGSRLRMYLLRRAYFSKLLVERRFKPRSVRIVAVCTATDAALEPIAAEHGVGVVVVPLDVG